MNLPPQLVALLQGHAVLSKPVLDILPIPKAHVFHVLTLLQKSHETTGLGKNAARIDLWRCIHRIMPATRRKMINLDVSNATVPIVEIRGEYRVPTVGKRNVIAVYPLPAAYHYKFFELVDLMEAGPLHRYNLWTYIGEIIPEVAADPNGDWSYDDEGEDVWIVLKAPKKTDEEGE